MQELRVLGLRVPQLPVLPRPCRCEAGTGLGHGHAKQPARNLPLKQGWCERDSGLKLEPLVMRGRSCLP